MLRAGCQEPVHLTFNNIRTLEDFAAILSRQLGIDSTEFLQLARNAEYVKKLGFTPENFIGKFIPNTYQVYWHTPVEDFIQRMYKEYRKFWTEERLVKARKADLYGYSDIGLDCRRRDQYCRRIPCHRRGLHQSLE